MCKLNRTKQSILDNEMETIEEKLESRKIRGKERKKLRDRLKLLEEIENKRIDSFNSECPDFDNFSYGGSTPHDD